MNKNNAIIHKIIKENVQTNNAMMKNAKLKTVMKINVKKPNATI
jgi:hypothetical protein